LDEIKTQLPENIKSIKLKKIDLINVPVYTFSIVGNYYPSVMYDKLRFLEDELKKIPQINDITVI